MQNQKPYSWLYYACSIEGAIAFAWLLSIPSEGGRVSLARLVLLGIVFFLCAYWIYWGYRPPQKLDRFAQPAYIVGCAVLALTFCLLLFLLRYLNPDQSLQIFERLSPLLWYVLVLAIQMFFFLLFIYKGFHPSRLVPLTSIYISAAIALTVLLIIFGFIVITRLGVTFDPAYWGEPGVPVLGWQFALALILGGLAYGLAYYLRPAALNVTLSLFIYFLAIGLWLNVPVDILKNSFYMRITAPAYTPFPYSDSSYYDQMAQSLLIGHPYQGVIPTRPLYIFFLTLLHFVFGENYPHILIGQTLVLALIPVVLYFLGRKLHSQVAGVTVALLFIFRELTSLLISSETRVTNTKMILVDLPTLLLLLVSCIYTFRWLEKKEAKDAFVAGGLFGVLLLLRTQSLQIFPLIILIAMLVLGWRNKTFYLLSSLFLIGVTITVAPWLTHNYLQTGRFAFDAAFQVNLIVSQYAAFGNLDISNYNFEGMGLGRILLEFAIRDPQHVFGFITNHFLATQINALLVLPLIEPYYGLFKPINLYWMNWHGQLAWYNSILLILYLIIISLGLGVSWRRWRWLGLLPLFYSIGYALATALARFSSWRYDFPSDWIAYFYFGIGFAEIIRQSVILFGGADLYSNVVVAKKDENNVNRRPPTLRIPALALFFIFIGGLPWIIKGLVAPRYSDQSSTMLSTKIASIKSMSSRAEIDKFVSQPGSFLQVGRLLYPRFFVRDAGLSSANPSPAYSIREYPRLGFFILNQKSTAVVFPTETVPDPVSHAEDVIVLGCQRDSYVEARLIFFPESNMYYTGIPLTNPCSP